MSEDGMKLEESMKKVMDICNKEGFDIVMLFSCNEYDMIRHTNNTDLRDAENRLHRYIDDISAGFS